MNIDELEDEELEDLEVPEEDEFAPEGADEDALLEGDDEPGDEFEEPRLTLRQKIVVTLTVFVSFIWFSFVFFPYEEVIRFSLAGFSRQVQIEFTSMDLGYFRTTVRGLRVQLPDGSMHVSVKDLDAEEGLGSYITSRYQGLMRMLGVEFSTRDLAFEAARLDVNLNLDDASVPPRMFEGRIGIRGQNISFSKLPLEGLPIPGIDPSELQISSLELNMDFSNGQVNFQDSRLASDLFSVRLSGTGQMQNSIGTTILDTEICLDPVDDLQERNPQLFGLMLAMGGSAGGEVCADLNGPVGRPEFKLRRPEFGAPGNTGTEEGAPSGAETTGAAGT